jgi:hypothetical protein
MSPSEPSEPNSPSCFAHEADDAYMGYATPAELSAFLQEVRVARSALVHRIRQMLPKVRDDALYRDLATLANGLDAGNMPEDETFNGRG